MSSAHAGTSTYQWWCTIPSFAYITHRVSSPETEARVDIIYLLQNIELYLLLPMHTLPFPEKSERGRSIRVSCLGTKFPSSEFACNHPQLALAFYNTYFHYLQLMTVWVSSHLISSVQVQLLCINAIGTAAIARQQLPEERRMANYE